MRREMSQRLTPATASLNTRVRSPAGASLADCSVPASVAFDQSPAITGPHITHDSTRASAAARQ